MVRTSEMMPTDLGYMPRSTWKALKRYNVPPAFFWELEDAFTDVGIEPNYRQIEKFIRTHSTNGSYDSPWPFKPEEVRSI